MILCEQPMLSSTKMNISFHWLLAVYAIVPILLGIVLIDIFVLDRILQPYTSVTLVTAFLYLLFFELPHVFASFFSFADKEYLHFYKKKLLHVLPIILAVGLVVTYINLNLGIVLMVAATLYHVVMQQTGIATMIIGVKHVLYTPWSLSAVTLAISIQLYLLEFNFITNLPPSYVTIFFTAILILFLVLRSIIYLQTKKGIGRKYLVATIFMLLSGVLFFLLGYVFFSIFVLRFTHDITAFIFYITHDTNRNADSMKNNIYKVLAPLKIPIIILLPVLGMLFAYTIRYELNIYTGIVYAGILISFPHYYIESFMWKRESLHRKQLAFTQ